MSDIHIQRFLHRARIRGASAERMRVDRAMAEMLDGGLESALLHAGVDTDEEICIRRFVTRSRLDLSRSDLQLTADWSNAWVDALRAVLQSGGDNVIRYRSRLHVVVDIATCIMRGDDSRHWAWRQLGVWSATPAGSADSYTELSRVLARHPSTVIPVCRVLAHGQMLGAWIAQLPVPALRALSQAALRAVDAEVDAAAVDDMPEAGHTLGAPCRRIAGILAASPLSAELTPIARAENSLDLAVFVVLAAEPAALRAGDARQLLTDVGQALLEAGARGDMAMNPERAGAGPGSEGESVVIPRSRPARIPRLATTRAAHAAARLEPDATGAEAGIPVHVIPDAAEQDIPELADAPSPPEQECSLRVLAHTGFGGLMYLLRLIEPSGVLDVAGVDPLAQRGLRWVLRQIALQLLPLDADDPVLNAFTGTIADLKPEPGPEPCTPSEAADIAMLTNRMVALLRERLHEPALTRECLLDTVCRRHADILFEPGWIELRFRLDAASMEIRRGGLDRDPGWVPWLGTVVKFAYV